MSNTLEIPGRFNGPLTSGNGGYVAGALAGMADGAVEVSLRQPVPLDRPLQIRTGDDGHLAAFDGDELIADAERADSEDFDLVEPPGPVSLDEAIAAHERYRGTTGGPMSHCFVCGRDREDALGVHAGPIEGRDLVASPWTPPIWTAGSDGASVRPEIVWAVLDCPTYFAAYRDAPDPLPISLLARFTARLDAPIRIGEPHVVIGWPIAVEGRKRHAASAIFTPAGETLAVARALVIEPRST